MFAYLIVEIGIHIIDNNISVFDNKKDVRFQQKSSFLDGPHRFEVFGLKLIITSNKWGPSKKQLSL